MKVPRCLRSKRFRLMEMLVLLILLPPFLLWWRESVFFVGVMSWWALWSTAMGGYQTAKAEEAIERGKETG